MTLIYGLSIVLGAGGLLAAVALALNPERPDLAVSVRNTVLGVFGFGIGGMSSSFGGWNAGLSFIAGLAGAVVLIGLATRYSATSGE
ncbi:MAG: hypothetical protein GY720_20050 [bacterium]|nr:hypothetical protein [bacterium]